MKNFIKKNIIYISLTIFLVVYFVIVNLKPAFLFNLDGSIKKLGFGNKSRTMIPIWFLVLVLGILSYMIVLYFLLI